MAKTENSMKTTLIITEKPQAAAKIAAALSNGTDDKHTDNNKVSYYEFEKNGKRILVGCAVGHLFGIQQKEARGGFPNFDVEWQPAYNRKGSAFTKNYFNVLKKLAKEADEFVIATDFDVEGEVIGWNVVRFIAGKGKDKDAKRMKFSSLTKDELESSYENLLPEIEWGSAFAGETRHYLDWFYGINLSRGLMKALSKTGKFRILSIGRVQGPALKIVVNKEKEIMKFKPEPYWQVFLQVQDIKNQKVEVQYPKDLTKESELSRFKHLKGKKGFAKTEIKDEKVKAPIPFDLTTLQTEAYKFLGLTPAQSMRLAQKLYLDGVISYPRTSSQEYPEAIGYDKILKRLVKHTQLVKYVTNKTPTKGAKKDPAHPAIYPTGEFKKMTDQEGKLYNLIVKRFISCFCNDALVENKRLDVDVEGLIFNTKGMVVKEKNWMDVYPTKLKEVKIPTINGDVDVKEIRIEEKMTKPPKRYTAASLVRELEKRNLGTKCLSGDTKVFFNGSFLQIEELFKQAVKKTKENDVEIGQINGNVVSLTKENIPVITYSTLISRRKISKNEQMLSIETGNSNFKLTSDHLTYALRDNKMEMIKAGELGIDDVLVSVLKEKREEGIILTKQDFPKDYIIKKNNLVHKFGGSKGGININSFPIKWSNSLAWILGYYYGDGSYSNPKYNGSHQFYFTTTEKKALDLLKRNIKEVFGNEPYCYNLNGKYKVNCNCAIASGLIRVFPEIEGKKPFNIPNQFIGDFLRGFFDADGNAHLRPLGRTKIKGITCNSFNTPRVKITLARKDLIEWISELLNRIDINNNFHKNISSCNGKKFDCWTILISGRDKIEKFAINVGFDTYKEDILFKGLECDSKNYKILRNCASIYLLLSKNNSKIEEIISQLGLSRYEVLYALTRLFRDKKINKKRFSQANRYIYSLKEFDKAYFDYCTKLIYGKIDKEIYAVPIKKIEKIPYDGYVYDLSVSKESPNFTIEGNILVHNSTRTNIVETLYSRGYINEKSLEASPLGIKIVDTLEKYSPIILDEELTREIEKEMEGIQDSKKDLDKKEKVILEKAKKSITIIAKDIEKNMDKIGEGLAEGHESAYEKDREKSTMTLCPVCGKGKLRIMYGKKFKRYFVSCDAYPTCKTTFSLPPNGMMKPALKKDEEGNEANEICKECGFPMVMALRKGKMPWKFCFNPECPSRKEYEANKEKIKEKFEKKKLDALNGVSGADEVGSGVGGIVGVGDIKVKVKKVRKKSVKKVKKNIKRGEVGE